MGQGKALDLILTGRQVLADECERIGLCEYVVPDGDARPRAEALAHDIARFPRWGSPVRRRAGRSGDRG